MNTPYSNYLRSLENKGRLRRPRAMGPSAPGRVLLDGRELLDFSSNDYLGLSRHPELISRACAWAEEWGTGARASRLVRGTLEAHLAIEAKLARAKGTPSALVMNSGFATNASVISALLDRQVLGAEPLVFADRLNHASMHEGCRLAGVRQIRYRHLDLNHLEGLLKRHAATPGPRFILTETVFSMDGDVADVPALADMAARYGAFLYLDEAHATGVLGRDGFGLAAGVPLAYGLVMGTFSKAIGSFGAYVACTPEIREYLVNRAGSFIYSTALPPQVLGAVDAAIDLLPGLCKEREHLSAIGNRLRDALHGAGLDTGLSATQIVPVMVGREEDAMALAQELEAEGLLCVAIRPPTVPAGTSRIRLALTAAHSDEDVDRLCEALTRLAPSFQSFSRGCCIQGDDRTPVPDSE